MAQPSEYKGKIYGSPLKDVLDAIIKLSNCQLQRQGPLWVTASS
jgi:hypothetical protein